MAKAKNKETHRHIIKEVGKKVFWRWCLDALFDWAVIVAVFYGATIWNNPIGYFLSIFVIGTRQHALAILGHDGTHFTIHKNKSINDTVSDVFALLPIGLSTAGYRSLHSRHHAQLNTADDPELMHRSSKAPQWDLPITLSKILRFAVKDIFGYSVSDYWMIISNSKPQSYRTYFIMALLHATFIGTFVYFNLLLVPAIWYISLLTTFMMYFRLRTWLEHQGDEFTHRLKLNWFERLIVAPHNVELHYEHHSYPSVSYKNLHQVRHLMPEKKVITLRDLILKYKNSAFIASGTPTKN